MEQVPTIETDELKEAIDAGGVAVVEVLMPKEYEKGHIPGAIHIHFATIGGKAREQFSKDQMIVTYCHNETCRASRIAAEKLRSLGYTAAYHYPGGKDAWVAAGFPLEPGSESELRNES